MKRELKVGDKVRFEDDAGTVCVGFVTKIYPELPKTIAIKCWGVEGDIHRRQVISVFKKKERPLIVWTTNTQLTRIAEMKDGLIYRNGMQCHGDIPLRPLTKKERERWGV